MENVKSKKDILGLSENKIIGDSMQINNSNIIFKGKGNLILCDGIVNIIDSNFVFNGDNTLVYLGGGGVTVNATIYNNSVLYIGKHNYFNPHGTRLRIFCTEQKHVLIGNDCLFSTGVEIHTADAHLIYTIKDRTRVNPSQSVYIGDKVWICQNVTLLKGTMIHSGSIIGASSVISNKKIPSNCLVAGSPGRIIRRDIFWSGKCVHGFLDCDTERYFKCASDDTVFSYDEKEYVSFEELDKLFSEKTTAFNKAEKMKTIISTKKERFAYQKININSKQ